MSKIINGYKVADGIFEPGTAAFPSITGLNSLLTTGLYFPSSTTIGFAVSGAQVGTWSSTALSLTNGQNLVLSGANAINEGNIQFQGAASVSYDSNLIHLSSTSMTMGMIGGSTAAFSTANGPYVALRGNTFTTFATQRGNLNFAAGLPSAPATGEGEIRFATGADVQRLVIDKAGVVYIPTPTTNRFVVGGTAALAGQMATIIGNTGGVGVLALQNTTAANAGYAQLDLYNSSGTNVAGFGYGNSATVAATQDRTYFYTVAKDFHISTDSNTTRQFIVAATSGAVSIATKATSGGVAGFTYTPGAHTAVTANVTDFSVAAHTMTITGGYASQIFSSFGAPIVTAASGLTLTNVANVNIEMASVAGSALITSNSALFLGSPAAAVTVNNASGTHLSLLETGNQSFTLTAATQVTSTIGVSGAAFGTMTVNQSGGAVTVDNAATVYIQGALTAGASVTITNNDALRVASGRTRLGGEFLASGTIIEDGTTTSSGAGAVAITGSIHEITTTGTGDALSLANGTEGQRIVIVYVAEGAGTDTAVLTPTSMGGGTTVTFSVVGQRADGVFTNGKWYFIAQGAVIA